MAFQSNSFQNNAFQVRGGGPGGKSIITRRRREEYLRVQRQYNESKKLLTATKDVEYKTKDVIESKIDAVILPFRRGEDVLFNQLIKHKAALSRLKLLMSDLSRAEDDLLMVLALLLLTEAEI